jgi:hypothetical protein
MGLVRYTRHDGTRAESCMGVWKRMQCSNLLHEFVPPLRDLCPAVDSRVSAFRSVQVLVVYGPSKHYGCATLAVCWLYDHCV